MTTALRTTDVIRVAVPLPISPGTRYRRNHGGALYEIVGTTRHHHSLQETVVLCLLGARDRGNLLSCTFADLAAKFSIEPAKKEGAAAVDLTEKGGGF